MYISGLGLLFCVVVYFNMAVYTSKQQLPNLLSRIQKVYILRLGLLFCVIVYFNMAVYTSKQQLPNLLSRIQKVYILRLGLLFCVIVYFNMAVYTSKQQLPNLLSRIHRCETNCPRFTHHEVYIIDHMHNAEHPLVGQNETYGNLKLTPRFIMCNVGDMNCLVDHNTDVKCDCGTISWYMYVFILRHISECNNCICGIYQCFEAYKDNWPMYYDNDTCCVVFLYMCVFILRHKSKCINYVYEIFWLQCLYSFNRDSESINRCIEAFTYNWPMYYENDIYCAASLYICKQITVAVYDMICRIGYSTDMKYGCYIISRCMYVFTLRHMICRIGYSMDMKYGCYIISRCMYVFISRHIPKCNQDVYEFSWIQCLHNFNLTPNSINVCIEASTYTWPMYYDNIVYCAMSLYTCKQTTIDDNDDQRAMFMFLFICISSVNRSLTSDPVVCSPSGPQCLHVYFWNSEADRTEQSGKLYMGPVEIAHLTRIDLVSADDPQVSIRRGHGTISSYHYNGFCRYDQVNGLLLDFFSMSILVQHYWYTMVGKRPPVRHPMLRISILSDTIYYTYSDIDIVHVFFRVLSYEFIIPDIFERCLIGLYIITEAEYEGKT